MNKRIILSTNDDIAYFSYVDIVVKAWRAFIPECKISFAYVGDNESRYNKIRDISDDSYWLKIIPGVPTSNHSKVARMIISTEYEDDIYLFSDIDMIPLQSEYFTNLFDIAKDTGNIVCCGFDAPCYQVHPDIGKVPVCYMVGLGSNFKELSNPNNISYEQLIETWKDIRVHDKKESINKSPFSDESLYRVMFTNYSKPVVNVARGWDNGRANLRIDKVAWNAANLAGISKGHYIDCHTIRPYDSTDAVLVEIDKYIESYSDE